MKKIRALVVDDSELIRQILTEILSGAPDIEVVGAANDPFEAREMIKQLKPDVLTLDIEMPKMDGISFLKNLMRLRPMPVVMISTLTKEGAPATLDALEIGAVDFIEKPSVGQSKSLADLAEVIQGKVRAAANANMNAREFISAPKSSDGNTSTADFSSLKVIAIGSSTGGTECIKSILMDMPENCPPILMVQHIPPNFATTFAERLNKACKINVHEGKAGMALEKGNAYLAPGDQHMGVLQRPNGLVLSLYDGEKITGHKPSVDYLFDSVAKTVGKHTVSAILTGMGKDGAAGMLNIKNVGGVTIAQDEETSVVWGMPGAAVKLGGVEKIMPIDRISGALINACKKIKN